MIRKSLSLLVLLTTLPLLGCPKEGAKMSENIKKVQTPYSISLRGEIERVEIKKPNGEKIVLEKKGSWKLVEPVDAELANFYEKKLESIFTKEILMDDLALNETDLKTYDLSKESAYKVALFTQGAKKPSAEFFVGRESSKGKEGRSFIKTLEGRPYQAKSEIASVVRADVDVLRSRVVFKSDKEPDSILIEPRKGERILFEKKNAKWEMTLPKKDAFDIAPLQVKQLVEAFTGLNSTGFGGTKSDKELDLSPPLAVATATFGDKKVVYEIGKPGKKIYFVRQKGSKEVYQIVKQPGLVLAGNYLIFKKRLEKTIAMNEILSFQLSGKEALKVEKREGEWYAGKQKLDKSQIAPLLGNFARMRAVRWKHKTVEEAGLGKKAEGKIIIKTKDKTFVFEIGSVFKKDGSRYARWSDSDYVMEIPEYIWQRAQTGLEALKVPKNKG